MISVIMPLYNNEKYVKEAIYSVTQQTYEDWELIIINDASIDSSLEVTQKYIKNDSRIRLINLIKNKGVSYVRNLGIKEAKGEYISFLDSDDLWDKDFLRITYEEINRNNFVYTKFAYIYDNKYIVENKASTINGYIDCFIKLKKNRYELQFPFVVGAVLIRKDFLDKSKILYPEDMDLFEDPLFMSKVLCKTKAYGINKILMFYRQHEKSRCHREFLAKDYLQELLFLDRLKEYAMKEEYEFKLLPQVISYRVYRVILIMIKKGFIKDAEDVIKKYEMELKFFVKLNYIRLSDRLRCKIFLKKNKMLLNLIGWF